MTRVAEFRPQQASDSDEWHLRVDLAAAFRLAAMHGWHEAVANHFSLAISPDGKSFLMNPRWRHFSRIKASDLIKLDAGDRGIMERPDAPDPTAWYIHGRMHAALPQARCVLHLHPPYATALAGLADPEIKPIDQNTARFFNRVAYDMGYGGMANSEAEGDRLAAILGNRTTMMMGNHGVLVAAKTVADAFDTVYYLERACQTLVLAYSTGRPLNVMSDAVAEKTAQEWEEYADQSLAHFEEMKGILAEQSPDFAD
jgi:ribulose-5-phosphate 4-epimerase/fuculose-1-phosphate aldolase